MKMTYTLFHKALRKAWRWGLEHSVRAAFFRFAMMVGEAPVELDFLISPGRMESQNGKGQGETFNY